MTNLRPRATSSRAAPTAICGALVYGGIVPEPPKEAAMTKRALISADNHVFEPVTLWQERLPRQFRAPRARGSNSATTGS